MAKKSNILSVGMLNKLFMGEVKIIIPKQMQVRRVPGGFIYEYLCKEGVVSSATFCSTDEFRNE